MLNKHMSDIFSAALVSTVAAPAEERAAEAQRGQQIVFILSQALYTCQGALGGIINKATKQAVTPESKFSGDL